MMAAIVMLTILALLGVKSCEKRRDCERRGGRYVSAPTWDSVGECVEPRREVKP